MSVNIYSGKWPIRTNLGNIKNRLMPGDDPKKPNYARTVKALMIMTLNMMNNSKPEQLKIVQNMFCKAWDEVKQREGK
ncbi:MAG: hypothetical protein GY853_01025 [PVC group bacterium]|nr:hypothetical protein [PVC group bacterium]